MANQGLQFEHAVMYVATSRILERDREQEAEFNSAAKQWDSIPQNIKNTAEKLSWTWLLQQNHKDKITSNHSKK